MEVSKTTMTKSKKAKAEVFDDCGEIEITQANMLGVSITFREGAKAVWKESEKDQLVRFVGKFLVNINRKHVPKIPPKKAEKE